ncbi:hypothetical protein F4604DRAFT_1770989 [Suillus subluteus]|nr:hypothetical protein F4604DRAFT_1770989 [Suillus subluteus]
MRARIVALHRRFVEVQLINAFESHCILRINFAFHPNCSPWTVNRRQFPSRPVYATTFTGFQGLTLARTVFDLTNGSLCSRSIVHSVVEGENAKRQSVAPSTMISKQKQKHDSLSRRAPRAAGSIFKRPRLAGETSTLGCAGYGSNLHLLCKVVSQSGMHRQT